MHSAFHSVFVASGSYIPETIIKNNDFIQNQFLEKEGIPVAKDNATIIQKFQDITEIEERRYAKPDQNASDLGYLAALDALSNSGIDPETLDFIIVAHNFGDVKPGSNRVDIVPSLASRIKFHLKIKNPDCVAYDLPFGCPGWLEGVIQANYYIRSGDAKRCLVIGTETLSRVIDPHDRDSMIYADGAGAVIMEATTSTDQGILSYKTQSHTIEHALLLNMGPSYHLDYKSKDDLFIKMNGRKLYEFALTQVPLVVKMAIEKAGLDLKDINKVLIHQANGKMDLAILQRIFKLYGIEQIPQGIMPMTISKLGNSSVATIPTLLDQIRKGKVENQQLQPGDKIVLASVGAGMNINAVVYQW